MVVQSRSVDPGGASGPTIHASAPGSQPGIGDGDPARDTTNYDTSADQLAFPPAHQQTSDHYVLSRAERSAQQFTRITGSWPAILMATSGCFFWASLNIMNALSFDPYPFTLLNFFLSASAALTAPVILMSQNTDRKIFLAHKRKEQREGLCHMNALLNAAEAMRPLTQAINTEIEQAKAQTQRCQDIYDHDSQIKLEKASEIITHKLGNYFGSWGFLIAVTSGIGLWTSSNFIADYIHLQPIDPPPYLFLNLTLSFISAFSAPIVVISQEYEDRLTREIDSEFQKLQKMRRGLEVSIKQHQNTFHPYWG
jgi:uncharacterized membrane protein